MLVSVFHDLDFPLSQTFPFFFFSFQNSTGDASLERSVRRLLASATLINQAVGDALSDLLFCEAVLRLKGWGCKVGCGTDAANKQLQQ